MQIKEKHSVFEQNFEDFEYSELKKKTRKFAESS